MVLQVSYHSIGNSKLGFEQRKATGRTEGINFEKELIKYKFNKKIEKVDVVCYSMGHTSAVGIIDYLKSKNYVLGLLYIIAPENAQASTINPKDFDPSSVWQYGADLNSKDGQTEDLCRNQDRAALQTVADGLDELKRVYIPTNKKGFMESHTICKIKLNCLHFKIY
jgi:hypothetical protein